MWFCCFLTVLPWHYFFIYLLFVNWKLSKIQNSFLYQLYLTLDFISATILDQHNFCDKSFYILYFSCKNVENHNWYYYKTEIYIFTNQIVAAYCKFYTNSNIFGNSSRNSYFFVQCYTFIVHLLIIVLSLFLYLICGDGTNFLCCLSFFFFPHF